MGLIGVGHLGMGATKGVGMAGVVAQEDLHKYWVDLTLDAGLGISARLAKTALQYCFMAWEVPNFDPEVNLIGDGALFNRGMQ